MADEPPQPVDLAPYLRSWERNLRSRNLQPKSIEGYMLSGRKLREYLLEYEPEDPDEMRPAPTCADEIHREHIEAWVTATVQNPSAATAALRLKHAKVFFSWLVEEEEIAGSSPADRVSMPTVDDIPPAVLTEAHLLALLNLSKGSNSYKSRRDEAIVRMFLDTGLRISELTNRTYEDLDLEMNTLFVMSPGRLGKGRRGRAVPFGRKTAQSLDRYLRARARKWPREELRPASPLWMTVRGQAMDHHAARYVITSLADQAGMGHVKPHQFRHTFSDLWKKAGGSEEGLMRICGWRSPAMARRYGESAAADRARDEHKDLSPGDRL